MIFRKYGMEYFKGGNIYTDFLDSICCELDNNFVVPVEFENISLTCCETIYFKDLLNKLTLKTSQDKLKEQLLFWEPSNKATRFYLPNDITLKIENDSLNIHKYLIDDFLGESFIHFLDKPRSSNVQNEYQLSYADLIKLMDHLDLHIPGFKEDFMQSLVMALDRTYEYELKLRDFENMFITLIDDKRVVALWGYGEVTERLFRKHAFQKELSFYIIDQNSKKHEACVWGHKVLSPSTITEKGIDTVIITSIAHADEIHKEISEQYPTIQNIIKLSDLSPITVPLDEWLL